MTVNSAETIRSNVQHHDVEDDKLKAVYGYLDKEMKLEGSASVICGAAAAWTVKEVLLSSAASPPFSKLGQQGLWLGSIFLFVSAAFFFLQRSRLANQYWHIARSAALPWHSRSQPLAALILGIDRKLWWGPYYLARGLLTLALGLYLVVLLWLRS